MSKILKEVMGSWMNPSPSTKAKSKPDDNDDGDNYDDHDHQEGQKDQKEDQHHSMLSRGVKRKANRDLRDEMVDDEGQATQRTPLAQRQRTKQAKSRTSETPSSSRRGKPSPARNTPVRNTPARNISTRNTPATATPLRTSSRRSRRLSITRSEGPAVEDNSGHILVPVADMGDAHEEDLDKSPIAVAKKTRTKSTPKNSRADANDRSSAKGKKSAAVAQDDEDEGKEQEIEDILEHRPSKTEEDAIELLIHWVGENEDEATWELEAEIQRGAAETLFDYWKTQGGRRRALFVNLRLREVYHPFRVLQHEKKRQGGFHFEVQWVGYSDSPIDTTWEAETKLKNSAPALLNEYWASQGGRDKFLARRGRAKKD